MKKIIIFSGYHLPHLGGMERYTDCLSRELKNNGYNVTVFTSKYDTNLKTEEKINDIDIKRLDVYNLFKSRFPILKKNSKNKKLLESEFNDDNIFAVICNTRFFLTTLLGINIANKKKIPVFVVDHGSSHLTLSNRFLDFFVRMYEHIITFIVKMKADEFYGVSNASVNWLKHFGIKARGIWYNSIDTSIVVPERKKHEKIVYTYAGRIIEQKGLRNIINAYVKLSMTYNNVELNIVGDGNMLKELEILSKNINNINIFGKKNFDELLKIYSQTDVFIYPPIWPEGLPTAILEAGLLKCAVITTDKGGNTEIIQDNINGLVVETNSTDLFNKMEILLKNQQLREKLSNQLYKDILKKFSWKNTTKKILEDIGCVEKIK